MQRIRARRSNPRTKSSCIRFATQLHNCGIIRTSSAQSIFSHTPHS
jgi:hypothetical protein